MSIWFQTRRVWIGVATAFAIVMTANIHAIENISVSLPSFLGSGLPLPLIYLTPLLLPIVVVWGCSSGDAQSEEVSARPISLFDWLYITITTTIVVGLCIASYLWLGRSTLLLIVARNVVGYIGMTLIAWVIVSPRTAALFPTGFLIFSALAGWRTDGLARWWAWPIADLGSEVAIVQVLCLFLLGSFFLLRRHTSVFGYFECLKLLYKS